MRKPPYKIALELYLNWCRVRNLSEGTIQNYKNTIERAERILNFKNPKNMDEKDVFELLKHWKRKPQSMRVFNTFLMYLDNNTIRKMRIRFPRSEPKRTWLTNKQMELLIAVCWSPKERLIIHLMAELGLRNIEVIRARLSDFQNEKLMVRGKGIMGGEIRYIPIHEDLTDTILSDWLSMREELLSKAQNHDDHLLVYLRGRSVHPYGQTGLKKTFEKLTNRTGFHFTPHTLRRTFARELRKNNVKREDIRDLLGHSSIEMTERYIGKGFDSMQRALKTVRYNKVYQITLSQ